MVEVDPADLSKALSEGLPPATAEKVWRLLGILRELQARPATRGRFTLKGGTALNIFHWPKVPRLSVDLDLMATGYPNAAPSLERIREQARIQLEDVSRPFTSATEEDLRVRPTAAALARSAATGSARCVPFSLVGRPTSTV